jgi:hypothetical protein
VDETTDFRQLIEDTEADTDVIELEQGSVYIKVSPGKEGFACEIYDRLNEDETGMVLACITRGMVEYAILEPEKLIEIGAEKFREDFASEHGFKHTTVGNA